MKAIRHLVLEGGGVRCAWQAGFILSLQEKGHIRPDFVSSVSASAAVACAMATGRLEAAVRCFRSCIAGNKKHLYLSHLFKGRSIFPHALIYREALLKVFDESAIEALRLGPEIKVLLTRTCSSLPGYLGVFAGLMIHALPGSRSEKPYPRVVAAFRFSKEFISARHCRTPAELAGLVLASSCTPPVTPLYVFRGRTALDGGLMESVPIGGLPEEPDTTLVLLTGKGGKVHRRSGFIYVEPSEKPHIASWNYTDPVAIDRLFELGQRDGLEFVKNSRDRKGV